MSTIIGLPVGGIGFCSNRTESLKYRQPRANDCYRYRRGDAGLYTPKSVTDCLILWKDEECKTGDGRENPQT